MPHLMISKYSKFHVYIFDSIPSLVYITLDHSPLIIIKIHLMKIKSRGESEKGLSVYK